MSLISSNPGPGISLQPQVEILSLSLPGIWLFASLPSDPQTLGIPTTAFTSDQGYVVWNGSAWVQIGGSGGGGVSFGTQVIATLAATQDDWSPSGYVAGVTNCLLITPFAGGSTWNGLVAPSSAWSVLCVNQSTTDSITIANLAGSSASANRFSCAQGVSAVLAPQAGTIISYASGHWNFS